MGAEESGKKNAVKSETRKKDTSVRIAVSIRKGKLVFFPAAPPEEKGDSKVDRGRVPEEATP
jgi:hypothetical protein